MAWVGGQAMALPNVDSSGEAQFPIHNQRFPMSSQVRVLKLPGKCGWHKCRAVYPSSTQGLRHRRPTVASAHIVDQDSHLNISSDSPLQRVQKKLVNAVVVEDVRTE